jgi:WD40 repeat protein/serine/threonine protein kinase
MEELVGQRIKGYELRDMIGVGGFGAVYRAYQPQVGREVAIKIILPTYANHPDFIRRFEVEAQVIARLEHPHIIPLYDYWRDAEGAYLVMRFLKGGSLRDRLKNGPLSLEQTSKMLDQIAGALAVAHRQGVIHRDIKPDNILLDDDGNAYLTDFGIAKDLAGGGNVTQADMVIGSPAYLSPEQVKSEEVVPQSDIYSLGVVLYEVLTGEHPFPGLPVTTLLIKHLQDPLPHLQMSHQDIPEGVDEVIQRSTAKSVAERFPDAPTLAAAFRRVITPASSVNETMMADARARIGRDVLIDRTLLMEELDVDNPYKGLQAFEEADSSNFFGRDALIERLLAKLREQRADRFMAVIGPSGSGKSSVVQAGLIPRMRRGTLPGSSNWFVIEMLPGQHPLEELEAALLRIAVNPPPSLLAQLQEDERGLLRATKRVLPDDKSELFLFIDQFEEVFTQAKDKAEVTQFLNSIVVAVTEPNTPLRVIITLRADFYDKPLLFPAFGDLVRRCTEVVLPMTPEELELAIAGPSERVGVVLEPGLVQQIIADISEQPGALPLLQYALTELFERRSGRVLTSAAYHALGGALGALARRADELYTSLDDQGEELARQLFLRLVTLGEGGLDDTRRRVLQTELLSIVDDAPAMQRVIDTFGKSRLLTFDHDPTTREPTIEVAHEALIREWQRLRTWLADSREDLLNQRKLEQAAGEWARAGKDTSYLASGARLIQFEEWQAGSKIALRPQEAEYLQSSVAEREAKIAIENARKAREDALERRDRRRLRLIAVVMALGTILASALAFVAYNQSVEASTNAQLAATSQAIAEMNAGVAENNAREARSLALAANARNALSEYKPSLGLALAIGAYNVFRPPPADVQQTLARAAYAPGVRWRLTGHSGTVMGVDTNGERGVSVGADGSMIVWDLAIGERVRDSFAIEDGIAASVAMTRDGMTAVTGMFDGSLVWWNLETGEMIRRIEGHTDIVNSVAFSPDETQILSGSMDRSLRLWDATSGRVVQIIETPGAILRVAFGPDGTRAASSSADVTAGRGHPIEEQDRRIRVWDLQTGEQIVEFQPFSGFVRAVAFSPDGEHVLSGTWNSTDGGTLQLWNIATGELDRRFYGHSDIISDVQFSPDGGRVLSVSWDRSLRIWDVHTGVQLQRLEGHLDRLLHARFTPDGEYVLVGSGNIGNNIPNPGADARVDSSVWLWDLRSRAEITRLTGHQDWVWSAAMSPDGRYGATGAGAINIPTGREADNTVRLWDLQTGEEIRALNGHTNTVNSVAFSPDGTQLLSASWDNTVRAWDVVSGEGRVAFAGHTDRVLSVAFSPDGITAASASRDKTIRLWEVATGEEIRLLRGNDSDVTSVTFSPDGRLIASASLDDTVRIWDVASGRIQQIMTAHTNDVNTVAFSPDGSLLLSGSSDGSVRLWAVATGEEVREFVGHTNWVNSVAFSPDGLYALSGSADLSVRLWAVATGDEIRRFDGHTNWVLSVAFAPDGSTILTGAEDNTARVWHMARTTEELISWAVTNRYVPVLTEAEREQYQVP